MINKDLLDYIRANTNAGKNFETIKKELLTGGWSDDDIAEAYHAMSPATNTPSPDTIVKPTSPEPAQVTSSSFANTETVPATPAEPTNQTSQNPTLANNPPVTTPTTPATNPSPQPITNDPIATYKNMQPSNNPQPTKKKRSWLFWIIFILLSLIVGAYLYLYNVGF